MLIRHCLIVSSCETLPFCSFRKESSWVRWIVGLWSAHKICSFTQVMFCHLVFVNFNTLSIHKQQSSLPGITIHILSFISKTPPEETSFFYLILEPALLLALPAVSLLDLSKELFRESLLTNHSLLLLK